MKKTISLLFILLIGKTVFSQSGLCFTVSADSLVGNTTPISFICKADFNNDGQEDFITILNNWPDYTLILSAPTGNYLSTGYTFNSYIAHVVASDFNNDANSDLAFICANNKIEILFGSGTGSFTSVNSFTIGQNPGVALCADFNNDGKSDLALCSGSPNTLSIFLGNGLGNFSAPTVYTVGSNPNTIIKGDFNNDGKLDLATSNSANVTLLKGNGNGTFSFGNTLNLGFYNSIPGGTNVIKAVDCTADNKLDIAGVKGDSLYFLKGNGNFTFSQPTSYYVGSSPSGVDFSDFNNDGKMDLVTANKYSQDYTILVGNGIGTFTSIVTYSLDPVSITPGFWPTSLVTTDVNNDGKKDIIIGYDNCFNLSILLNCNTVDVGLADNIRLNNDYKLYPNPAIDHLDLKISEDFKTNNKIEIVNSVGQLIKEEEIILNDQLATISLNDLPNGVYLLTLKSDTSLGFSKRFIIAR